MTFSLTPYFVLSDIFHTKHAINNSLLFLASIHRMGQGDIMMSHSGAVVQWTVVPNLGVKTPLRGHKINL